MERGRAIVRWPDPSPRLEEAAVPEPVTCRRCGAPIPAHAPRGACPACLLRDAMGANEPGSAPVLFGRPALASAGLDATSFDRIDWGSPPDGSHTLTILSRVYGEMPRVLLRDPPDSPETPVPAGQTAGGAAAQPPSARYHLYGEIARGGMGAILKGHDAELNRDLAFKVLLDRHRDNPELVRRFVEEAQIGGQLQHPGIVPIHELGVLADRRPFFAMKLVKGRTLAEILKERPDPATDRPRLLSIFEAVCQTVAYAHARGVIHRDLKPSNVMVGALRRGAGDGLGPGQGPAQGRRGRRCGDADAQAGGGRERGADGPVGLGR